MENLHRIQMKILKELLFNRNSRFTDLNVEKIDSDHFKYHLKKLVELEMITRQDGLYVLTQKGKVFAGRIDTKDNKITKQAKISIIYCGIKIGKSKTKYLIHVRKKEPLFGYKGFATGKIMYAESIAETAKRELEEETGLTGQPEFTGILHYTNRIPTGELLEDRILFFLNLLILLEI